MRDIKNALRQLADNESRECGETGRRSGLKIRSPKKRVGSTPTFLIMKTITKIILFVCLVACVYQIWKIISPSTKGSK